MLFATSSAPIGEIGSVATNVFGSFSPYVYVIIGLAVAFLIAETLIEMVSLGKDSRAENIRVNAMADKAMRDFDELR